MATISFTPTPSISLPFLTSSSTADPTGTAYIWGAPLSDRDKLLCVIFGFFCLGLFVVATISAFVYMLILKPRKLRAAQRAAAAKEDAERQSRAIDFCNPANRWGGSYKSHPLWGTESPIDVGSPPLTAMPPGRERSKKQKKPRIHNPESFR